MERAWENKIYGLNVKSKKEEAKLGGFLTWQSLPTVVLYSARAAGMTYGGQWVSYHKQKENMM